MRSEEKRPCSYLRGLRGEAGSRGCRECLELLPARAAGAGCAALPRSALGMGAQPGPAHCRDLLAPTAEGKPPQQSGQGEAENLPHISPLQEEERVSVSQRELRAQK